MSTPARSRSLLIVIAFAVVYIGWGTTYLANHFLLRELPPFVLGALRFFLAGGLALAWTLSQPRAPIQRSDWGSALAGGILLIAVGQGALIYANQYLPAGILAMLYTTLPLWSETLGSQQAALGKLSEMTHQQASIMAYNDAFHFIGIALGISMLAVFFSRQLPATATNASSAAH